MVPGADWHAIHHQWVAVARREASEFTRAIAINCGAQIAIDAVCLSLMAWLGASTQWMLVVSVVMVLFVIAGVAAAFAQRFDLSRAYIEQAVEATYDAIDR